MGIIINIDMSQTQNNQTNVEANNNKNSLKVVKVINTNSYGVELLDESYKQITTFKLSFVSLSQYEYSKAVIVEGNDITNFKDVVKYLTRKGYKVNGNWMGGFIMERA